MEDAPRGVMEDAPYGVMEDAPYGVMEDALRGVLDPADGRPGPRSACEAWLRVQRLLAFRPEEATERLARDPDPLRLLEALGGLALSVDAERRALAEVGAVLVPLPAAAYPERLRRLRDAAPVLAVQGDVTALSAPGIALVGPRAPSDYGLEIARRFGRELGAAGAVVISGLARGVDAAAHEGALASGGRTVAIQGCGPDRVYPAAHRRLAARIAAAGAVVSELPVGAAPRAPHFPLRNRLIAALAHAVVVVEARGRSGSLVTARHALDQGGEVLAVPGPISSPTSVGTNRLLAEGAAPALSPATVLRHAGLAASSAPPPPASDAHLGAAEARVVAGLQRGACTRDELARALEMPPEALAEPLLALELAGRVAEDRDGRLRLRAGAEGGRLFSPP